MTSRSSFGLALAIALGGLAIGGRAAEASLDPGRRPPLPPPPPDDTSTDAGKRLALTRKVRQAQPVTPDAGEAVHRLVSVQGYGKKVRLRDDAAESYERMIAAARRDGIPEPMLRLVSGYRQKAEQEHLWQEGLASHHHDEAQTKRWVARPGYSAHETGRAGDFWLGRGTAHSSANHRLRQTDAWSWLDAHAQEYGWHPYDEEAWHWEYGKPHDSQGGAVAAEITRGRQAGFLT